MNNRLVVIGDDTTPDNEALEFTSLVGVKNYYGLGSKEVKIAKPFFASNPSGTLSFIREGLGQRPHLLGANLSHDGLAELRNIKGSLSLTFNGHVYSGYINLLDVTSFPDAALKIRDALNHDLPVWAVTTGDSITTETVHFMGDFHVAQLYVTSVQSGKLQVGGRVFGNNVLHNGLSNQIIYDHSGSPGGPGHYSTFKALGHDTTSEPMTETYGVLTLGSVTSGTVAIGEEISGPGIPDNTAIIANLSGTTGPGSSWLINNAMDLSDHSLTMTGPPLSVVANQLDGATGNNDFFEIAPNGAFGFDKNPSTLSFASGSAAGLLGLAQESGAIDSSPGGQHPSIEQWMTNVLLHETNQFGQPLEFNQLQCHDTIFSSKLETWAHAHDIQYV